MKSEVPKNSLLGHLQQVRDARRREGKIYPLWSMLGMLVLAALNGQKNLAIDVALGCKTLGENLSPLRFYWASPCTELWSSLVCLAPA